MTEDDKNRQQQGEEFELKVNSLIAKAAENSIVADMDKVGEHNYERAEVALLSPNATNTDIINKINEIIYNFNKSLREYRI